MLFNSISFAIFFALVLLIHRMIAPRRRVALLLAASLLFYFLWIPPYLLLLGVDVLVNYALLRAMRRSRRPRVFLALACVFSLGLLAYYKYAAFLVTTVFGAMGWGAGAPPTVPHIVLPLGISFYTFQILGLAIDVYRGDQRRLPGLGEYALFIGFFPQLIAGPILRGRELLPQLSAGGRVSAESTRRGVWLLASGLLKKVVLADFLLRPHVDAVFANPGAGSGPDHLIAVYGFAFVIYFDFSGYTDIARGLARLLGFTLPLNFREPYLSRNPVEFWRRWHITLSSWLRDYLYIPLGGNRRGRARTLANLLVTMLLGGLWHGAAWSFVLWGGLHGLWLALHRRWRSGGPRPPDPRIGWRDVARIGLCFHAVCALWILFRAPTLGDALAVAEGIVAGGWPAEWPWLSTALVLGCGFLHVAERAIRTRLDAFLSALDGVGPRFAEGAALGVVAALTLLLGGAGSEVIYFQF